MPSTALLLFSLLLPVACATPGDDDGPALQGVAATVDPVEENASSAGLAEPDDAPMPTEAALSLADQLSLLTSGADALAAGDPESALLFFGSYLATDPDNGTAFFLQGIALLDLGRLEEARGCLLESVRLEPEDAGGHSVLARVHYDLGEPALAIAALERATELEPEAARHQTSLGLLYFDTGRWAEAYEAFVSAVELDVEAAEAHRGLARLYAYVGELDLAERAYRTTIELLPDDAELLVALAHVVRDQRRSMAALDLYLEADRLQPENPWIHANLGSTYLELDRPAEARPWFERALPRFKRATVDVAMVQLNYAMTLRDLGDLDGAELFFESSLEMAPTLGRAHEALGLLQLDRGRGAAASDHLAAALQLDALAPEGIVHLVRLQEDAGDWDAAHATAAVLLAAPSDGGEIDYRRAQLQTRSQNPRVRDPSGAIDTLEGLVAGPLAEHVASWVLLAEALVAEGRLEQAVAALDRAVAEAQPRDPLAETAERRREWIAERLDEDRR